MRPQIGMTLHYVPLDDDGKPAKPRPALVMGADEHEPPNLDIQVFRPLSEGAGPEHMALVPPASSTVTGSGWAWPEWMLPPLLIVHGADGYPMDGANLRPGKMPVTFRRPGGAPPVQPGDILDKGPGSTGGTMTRNTTAADLGVNAEPEPPAEDAARAAAAAEVEANRSREGQEGSVILLALGMIVVAGILSTALGL